MSIAYKKPEDCTYDVVSLGEVMLRLDPGEGRIHTARQFTAWEGGGEYNVARGFRRCFGLRAAIITALADNPIGRLVEDFILQGGVDATRIVWRDYDGIGTAVRNGINFTERGFGVRGARGCSDRGHTAASQMTPDCVDWDELFGKAGVRHFHTGGIFAALGKNTPETVITALKTAKKYGTITSYDLNYRPSLWKAIGGKERAQEVNRELAKYVDVMIGNEEDFTASLGLEVEGVDENLSALPIDSFKRMIEKAVKTFPNFQAVGTTLRTVHTASINDWGAICWHDGKFHLATMREKLEIMDRVGGGDSFASGFIYGLMVLGDAAQAVEYGAAHGALAMTTPGDTTMVTLPEVKKLVDGGSARVDR